MSTNKLYKKVENFLSESSTTASYKLQDSEKTDGATLVKQGKAFYSKDYEHIALYKPCHE